MFKIPKITLKNLTKKFFCTKEKSPLLNYMFEINVKKKKLPCFEAFSSQVEILKEPMDFYLAILVRILLTLKKMVKDVKERIVISSLYLGTGKMEEFLVKELLKAAKNNPKLKITIVLDKERGLRDDKGKSSETMLRSLVTEVLSLFMADFSSK